MATVEVWGATLTSKPGDGDLEKALAPAHIACMASGTVGGVVKYYFYAQGDEGEGGSSASPPLAIGEVSITASSLRLSAVVKASTPSVGSAFVEAFKKTLGETGFVKA